MKILVLSKSLYFFLAGKGPWRRVREGEEKAKTPPALLGRFFENGRTYPLCFLLVYSIFGRQITKI